MALKTYKPTSPSRRFMTGYTFEEITKSTPEKSLLAPIKRTGGRNNNGRITSRRMGGGHKRHYRMIDFKRNKFDVPGKVAAVEYDPNRTCRIALIHYLDGDKRYILAPVGLTIGQMIVAGPTADIKIGNTLPLKNIPVGTIIHNVEMKAGKGGQMARSAGTSIQLMAREGGYALLKLPSGEGRRVREECLATIGQLGNVEHANISLGKAGRARYLGRRPKVRGVAMNPIDHPMGGGEGKTSGGRHPVSPWGQKAKGLKTRKKKTSDKFIVTRRK